MKAKLTPSLAALSGMVLGAIGASGLHAQTKPAAYYITQIELIGDADTYVENYASKVGATVEPFGGRFPSVRGAKAFHLEGEPTRSRNAIIQFDNIDKAQAWYNSAAYQEIAPIRRALTKTNSYLVEGPIN